MDSLSNIISGRNFDEPPEIGLIKNYVKKEFNVSVNVQILENSVIISVPNAALANTLRLRGPHIKQLCKTNKRLTFRISS